MTEFNEVLEVWREREGWAPYPTQCRWFMTTPLDDLPNIHQCLDCGIYVTEEGRYISPVMVNIMRTVEEEGWPDGNGQQGF